MSRLFRPAAFGVRNSILHRWRTRLKVLFITGFAENAAIGNGHLDSGMSVITKPFVNTVLANKVRQLIDG